MPRKKNINCMFCGRSVADGAQLVPAPGGDTAVCIDCVEAIQHHRAFKKLQQSLLNTLATYVPCDGGIVALATYLVDFVDEHYAALSTVHIIVGGLQKACKQAFYILAHISGLRQNRSVHNSERHVEQTGNSFGKQSLTSPSHGT